MNMDLVIYIVVGTIAVSYFLLIFYQSVLFLRASKDEISTKTDLGITLIVPFKNESKRIKTLLKDINAFEGNHKNFEIVFINDHSDDETVSLISEFLKIDHKIILSDGKGKKESIAKGVEEASYDVIVTLDADVSVGLKWLEQIRQFFSKPGNHFLIMPVLIKQASTTSGFFESLDVLALTGTTIAWAKARNPILCNGANMGFRKNLFERFRDNAKDLKLVSGDDVFFMHQVKALDKNTVGVLHDMSVVAHTNAFNNFASLLNQRARWTSKSRFYKDLTTNVVSWIVLLTYFTILLLGLFSITWHSLINLFLIVFIGKIIIDFFFLVLLAVKFDKVKSLWFYPIAVLIQFIFIPMVLIKSQWGEFEWKGRKYKR